MAVDAWRTLALYSWTKKRRYNASTSTGMAHGEESAECTRQYTELSHVFAPTAVIGGFFMPSSRRNFVKNATLLKDIMGYAMLPSWPSHRGGYMSTYWAIEQLNNSNAASLKQRHLPQKSSWRCFFVK